MAIVIGNVSDSGLLGSSGSSATHNCNGTLLVITVEFITTAPATTLSATYNGVAMSLAKNAKQTIGFDSAHIFYLKNPAQGVNTIQISGMSGQINMRIGAVSITGADATTPIGATASALFNNTANPWTCSLTTTAANSYSIDCFSDDSGENNPTQITPNNGQTIIFKSGNSDAVRGASGYKSIPTAAANTLGYTLTGASQNNTAAICAVEILAATTTAWTKTLTESTTITDTLLRAITRPLSESTTITDSLSIGRILTKLVTELATITDTLGRSITKLLSETATITEAFVRSIVRTFSESLSMTATFSKTVQLILTEAVTVTDVLKRFLNGILIQWSARTKPTLSPPARTKPSLNPTARTKPNLSPTPRTKPQ
jgi:hypothetical protein